MNVFGWYFRRSRSRSSDRSSPRDSLTCSRTPVIALRRRLIPVAASLARPGSRSGPKMNSAASARTMISPHPIESNTAAPVVRDRPRGHPSLDRRAGVRPGRDAPLVSGLVQGCLELPRAAVTDDLDGDRVARVVGVDRDDEFL